MRGIRRLLRRFFRQESGFSLLEVVVTSAVSAFIVGMLGVSLYHMNRLSSLHRDALTVTQQVQSSSSLLNRDIIGAKSGTVSGSTLTLYVPSYPVLGRAGDPITNTITYTLNVDHQLVRSSSKENESVIAGRNIGSVSFGPNGAITRTVNVALTSLQQGEQSPRTTVLSFQRRPYP